VSLGSDVASITTNALEAVGQTVGGEKRERGGGNATPLVVAASNESIPFR
jgi:hypothetical protein